MKSLWVGVLGVAIGLFFADIAAEVEWRNARVQTSEPYISPYKPMPVPKDRVAGQTDPQVKAQDPHEDAGNPVSSNKAFSTDPREEQSDTFGQKSGEELKIAREANDIAREDKDIQAELATVGWWTILSQVFLAVVQFFFLWRANWHAEEAALAAKKSADAALIQTKVMESRERPWIMVTPDNPEGGYPVGGTEPFLFRFRWIAKNVGSSPAFLTKLYVAVATADLPIPDQEMPYPGNLEGFAKFILPSDREHEGRAWANLSPEEIEGYVSGRKCILFHGLIEYNGAFSGPHRTRFCCYWEKEDRRFNRFNPVGPPKTIEYT